MGQFSHLQHNYVENEDINYAIEFRKKKNNNINLIRLRKCKYLIFYTLKCWGPNIMRYIVCKHENGPTGSSGPFISYEASSGFLEKKNQSK